jgi:hypothetical protein
MIYLKYKNRTETFSIRANFSAIMAANTFFPTPAMAFTQSEPESVSHTIDMHQSLGSIDLFLDHGH